MNKYLKNQTFVFKNFYFISEYILYTFKAIYDFTIPLLITQGDKSDIISNKDNINIFDIRSNFKINMFWNKNNLDNFNF